MGAPQKKKLIPTGDRVIAVQIAEDDVTASGIVIARTEKEMTQRAKVIAIGEGEKIKEGDTVVIPRHGGIEIESDAGPVLVLRELDILAVEVDA